MTTEQSKNLKECGFVASSPTGPQWVPVPLEEGLRTLPMQQAGVTLQIEFQDGVTLILDHNSVKRIEA